jgi:hypothetical protein
MACDGGLICNSVCTPVMTDPLNCGRCAHDCGPGAKCMSGICQAVLVTTALNGGLPVALATDAPPDNPTGASAHVFWAVSAGAPAGVYQDNVAGGNLLTLSTGPAVQSDVAVHGAAVYWPTYNNGNGIIGILKGNVGMAASQLGVGNFMAAGQYGIILDGAGSQLFGNYTQAGNYGIYRCALNMTACTSVIAFAGKPAFNMATDGTYIYMADSNGGEISSVRINGGNTAPVAMAQATPNLLRVDGMHLYWSNSGTKTLWKGDLPAGANKQQIASTANAATGLAADAVNVYWTDSVTGTVNYAPIGGGGMTTTYVTQGTSPNPMRLVRDGASLYWIYKSSIYRVALP